MRRRVGLPIIGELDVRGRVADVERSLAGPASEGVAKQIVDILRPLPPEARGRVLDELQEKIEGELEERRLGQFGPLTPARRAVVERAYFKLCQEPVSKREMREAFATLTAVERQMVVQNLREEAERTGKGAVAEEMIHELELVECRYDRLTTAMDEAIERPIVNAARRQALIAQRQTLKEKLGDLDRAMKTEGEPFLRFCASVRGYEPGPEPGAYMMALGRLFVGEEESAATELADLLEGIEGAARNLGWERFAPNAKACFEYLKGCIDEEPLESSGVTAYNLHFARRWARVGFPVVEMGHRTAASLMFTHGTDAIESPWPAFVVKVPDGLVVLASSEKHATLVRVLVLPPSSSIPVWNLRLDFRRPSGEVRPFRVPMKSLDGELTEEVDWTAMEAPGKDVGLRRAIEMVGRLVAGACMLASAKQDIVERPWQPKAKSERRRSPGVEPPTGTRFIVTKNVALDLRDQVHEYIGGKSRNGAKLTVQFVVRGHRRWQACGPHHSQHKLIWVNPYWKGPEEGRALVRGYELRGPDAEESNEEKEGNHGDRARHDGDGDRA